MITPVEEENITAEQPAETAEEEEEQTEAAESRKSIVSRVSGRLMTAVLVVLIGFMAYATVSAARGKIVEVFGKSLLVVVTGSMEPTLHVGDYIFVEKTPPEALAKGDVIAFYSEADDIFGMLVTHRIVGVNEDGTFVTRGDANPVDDRVSVRPERIVGKYTGKARFFRWASSFGDTRKLLLMLVMIPTAVAAIYEVRTIAKLGVKIGEQKKAAEAERERSIREAIEKEKERLAREGLKPEDLEQNE